MSAFYGLTASRQVRRSLHRDEGLLALVKDSMVYQRINESYQQLPEKQLVQVGLLRQLWVSIHNLYAAPIRGDRLNALTPEEDRVKGPGCGDGRVLGTAQDRIANRITGFP